MVIGCALLMLARGRAAAAEDRLLLIKIDREIRRGDAWNEAIPRVAKLLGTPAIATADHIEWAYMNDKQCVYVTVKADPAGFVEMIDSVGLDPIAERFAACKKLSSKKAKLPAKLKGPKQLDVDKPAVAVIAHWGKREYDAMFDEAHPLLHQILGSSAAFAQIGRLVTARVGPFKNIGAPAVQSRKDFGWMLSVPVEHEKATLVMHLRFNTGKAGKVMLTNFDVRLPEALAIKSDPKQAATAARAALDLLLAAKVEELTKRMHWKLVNKLPTDLGPQLDVVLKKVGKVRAVKQLEQRDCDDGRQCFTFEVQAAGGKAPATFDMGFVLGEWLIFGFNLDPPQ